MKTLLLFIVVCFLSVSSVTISTGVLGPSKSSSTVMKPTAERKSSSSYQKSKYLGAKNKRSKRPSQLQEIDHKLYSYNDYRTSSLSKPSVGLGIQAKTSDVPTSTSVAYSLPTKSTKLILKNSEGNSWVEKFLNFKSKEKKEIKAKAQKIDTHRKKLKSTIKKYDSPISDLNDLKQWTREIVHEKNKDSKFNDFNFKKYGVDSSNGKNLQQPVNLNMEDFIQYLVIYQNFKQSDLEFLKSSDLDHGLDEIEQELDKIKEGENKKPKSILIGGEYQENEDNSVESIGTIKKPYLFYLILLVLFI